MNLNTKTKKKINVVDILILIAILAAIVCAGFVIIRGMGTFGEKVNVSYTIAVDPIDSDFVSKVSVGDGLYEIETTDRIGTVSAVSDGQAYIKSYSDGADPRGNAIEGMSVLYITLTAKATKTDTGYIIGNSVIGIGRELEMRFPNLYCIGKCVRIERIEE